MKFQLEICADSIESALNAQEAGAHRIELCDNLAEGGTTPGAGIILSARSNLTIGVHVLIRPRGGDFLYSDLEYDIMRRDIDFCGEAGVNGVVFGILDASGNIDIDRTSRLIGMARPMSVTFHRAFDLCNNPDRGLEDIIESGADRLLTSGHKNKAEDGLSLIQHLVALSRGRIIIMPGAGINQSNIDRIARVSAAKEFHLTGRKVVPSDMIFIRNDVSLGGNREGSEYSRKVADTLMIRAIIDKLKMI